LPAHVDVLGVHHLRLNLLPHARSFQGFYRSASVGRGVGFSDRHETDFIRGQILQRFGAAEESQLATSVDMHGSGQQQVFFFELADVIDVRRGKDIEGRAVLYLASEVAGRRKTELHRNAGRSLKIAAHFLKDAGQVGGCGDR